MNFFRTWLVAICLPTVIGISAGWAQTVVSNQNVFIDDFPFAPNSSLAIAQDVAFTDFTSFEFIDTSGILSLANFTLDEGSDWYEVFPGEELSIASTLAGNNNLWGTSLDPSLFPVTANSIVVDEPFFSNPLQLTAASDFYVGFATTLGTSPLPNGPEDRDVFGWARVLVLGSGLPGEPQDPFFYEIAESAVAYDSAGIFVGTTQAISVPEPSTGALLMMGTLLFVRRRRSKTH